MLSAASSVVVGAESTADSAFFIGPSGPSHAAGATGTGTGTGVGTGTSGTGTGVASTGVATGTSGTGTGVATGTGAATAWSVTHSTEPQVALTFSSQGQKPDEPQMSVQ